MSRASAPSGDDAIARKLLREIPAVERILDSTGLAHLRASRGRGFVLHHLRATLDELRRQLLNPRPGMPAGPLGADEIAAKVARRIAQLGEPLPRVLNATGVILHSGLGRAPISTEAAAAAGRAAGYALLEVDRDQGVRASRDTRAGEMLLALTGAEASLVVNNNAAATLLILTALAKGREVVCSRGELVEIGGSFRIPDVMEASGCRLVAVGTTNKTHLADYAAAINERTAALLVVHTSNYRIVGFTSTPELAEVATLAHERGLPLIHDLGSGTLLGPAELGLGDEPPVKASLAAGADIVCMSGDKLLGGPQAGIILGRKDLVASMRSHALARALRIDKMTVAALEATLQLFLDPETLRERHPVIRMLTAKAEDLRPRAEDLAARLRAVAEPGSEVAIIDGASETGSGALPTLQIPTLLVSLKSDSRPDALARRLRHATPAVFTRIIDDRVCFDLRTLLPGEEVEVASLVAGVLDDLKHR